MKVTVVISGASGAIYAYRLLCALASDNRVECIYTILTRSGLAVWQHECAGGDIASISPKIEMLDNDNFFAPIASGSAASDAMVIVPSSMGMVGRLASGVSSTLAERAADVQLKERLPLVIVARETPLSLIHLRNLTTLTEAGAVILPACPSFYSNPTSIDQLVDTVVERIMDKIGLKSEKNYRWNQK